MKMRNMSNSKQKCILCGGYEHKVKFAGSNIYQCNHCGLIFCKPVPSQDELNTYFRKYFMRNREMIHNVRLRNFKREIKLLKKYKPVGNLLDVGCATGKFLQDAIKVGWKCYGVEMSEMAGNYVSKNLKIEVQIGQLKDSDFPEKYFDVITLHHVIEHMSNPLSFLKDDVNYFLKDDGLLVIEVPNARSLQAFINKYSWQQFRDKAHFYHFTTDSLVKLVEAAGYKPDKVFTQADPRYGFYDTLRLFGLRDSWIDYLFRGGSTPDSSRDDIDILYDKRSLKGLLRYTNKLLSYPLLRLYEILNLECLLFAFCWKK